MVENTIEKAKNLLNSGKFRETGALLNMLLGKDKNNDELWYLRGLVSLKLKNYETAQEYFERALWIKKRAEYYQIKGMAHMEMYEFEEAIDQFEKAAHIDEKNPSTFFYIALCYMFLNNPVGKEYMEKAYSISKKKTKELVKNFYSVFFKEELTDGTKKDLESKIENISV